MNNIHKDLIEFATLSIALFLFAFINSNYLLFHVVIELFSIIVLFVLFAITWNTRSYIDNKYLMFFGLAAAFIGSLDLLHTLTYNGMDIIATDKFYANQFWIGTRFFESVVLLIGFAFVSKKNTLNISYLMIIYASVTTLLSLSILEWEIFPVCYIENVGQTPFKIISEYVIISILIISLYLLYRNKNYFTQQSFTYVAISILLTALSEFMFTLYFSNFDGFNKIGHIFKGLSFFLIYKVNIVNGFQKPTETLFINLKKSEENVKKANAELELEIATKNKFFSIISHDLRNPFNSVLGFTQLLLLNHKKYDDEKREKFIQNIFTASKKTYELLENLLTWSRTQNNTISFNPRNFNIFSILGDNLQLTNNNAMMKNISISMNCNDELFVYADIDMVNTILRNLLTNAIKFTPKFGDVSLKVEKQNEKDVLISVSDTGVGIAANSVEKLFRIDQSYSTKGTEDEAGTGLGLVLCAEFVKKNKGKIWVESTQGAGSTFYFTLPAGVHQSK